MIGPATKAIAAMHYGGFACDMDSVADIAERHGLVVVEDAAHAPGATWRGRACGTLGLVGCFSFFSNKNLPVGEGGMIVTDDDDLAARLKLLRSHGMTTLTWDRHRGHAHSYDVVAQGFNYRIDEMRAALGLVQLSRLSAENAERGRIAARYREELDGREGLSMPFQGAEAHDASSHHLAVVLVPEGVDRDGVRTALTERGIQTSVHYPPIHEFTHYADASDRRLPHTESAAKRVLTLPLFAHMTDEQVALVVDGVLAALSAATVGVRATAGGPQ